MMVAVVRSDSQFPIQARSQFSCTEELVLSAGRVFDQPQIVQLWNKPFDQALLVAMSNMDAIYCEGFAMFEGRSIPLLTAWVLQDGQLLVPAIGEYFGVPIDTLYACGVVLETGNPGVLASDGSYSRLRPQDGEVPLDSQSWFMDHTRQAFS